MKFFALFLSELLAQKDCPASDRCTGLGINEVWKQCKNIFPDVIAAPNGGSVTENPNPARQGDTRNNWASDFQQIAPILLDNQSYSNSAVKTALIDWLSKGWPADGWIVVVSLDNKPDGCREYNGIDNGSDQDKQCFNHWYSGCRENKTADCRNQIAISRNTYAATGARRIAFASQINKKIEHMRNVDTKHVMWWASHAEGCDTAMENGQTACAPCDQSDATCRQNQVKSKFGVSAANLNMAYPEHKNMAAKLVWQHYRQALDKEWNSQSDNECADWNAMITVCNGDPNSDPTNGEWEDVAWEEINVPREHYHIDYREYEIGLQRNWYGNNGAGQCITLFVTPFSH